MVQIMVGRHKDYPSKEEISAFCAALYPMEAVSLVLANWRKGNDINALGFVVDGKLFDQWLLEYRETQE